VTRSIRADLTLGIAYGLAVSTVFWALLLDAPAANATELLLLALCAAAGALATVFRRSPRIVPTYAVAVTALLVAGPALSCLGGGICAVAARTRVPVGSHRRVLARVGFRASREILALALAALGFAWVGVSTESLLGPLAVHAAIYALAHALLVGLARLGIGARARYRTLLRNAAIGLPGSAVGMMLGWAASVAFLQPAARPLLVAAGALVSVWAVQRTHRERQTMLCKHSAQLTSIQREVSRALARTMEERDPQTQDHLNRVHRLCVGVAKSLELSNPELETLASAALLHDIGKVAIPEAILSKPGRLTEEEMERVKRHPIVGAEIVEGLPFQHALAPIIRYHHERWDGGGYPDGLEGSEIPLGARILAAVDCYDALTTDRPYRKALSHREGVAHMTRESGRTFDPEVVDALVDYLDSRAPQLVSPKLVEQIEPPEPSDEAPLPERSLITAQRELETLYDISRAMSYGLNLEEFLTLASCRLSSLVPYRSLVAYFVDEGGALLRARFAVGQASDKLRLMTIPVGERLSGWAATHRRAVIGRDHVTPVERDGSRSDLEDWVDDPEVAKLGATLAAPMVAEAGLVGVVTLYDEIDRGFTAAERRILARVAGCMAKVAAREGAGPTLAHSSLTDPLTGVPNARFLWLESAHRMGADGDDFGVVAFRVAGLDGVGESQGNEAVDRMLCEVARRFAGGCRPSETLVRFGQDLFIVLTPVAESGELIQRWHELVESVEQEPLVKYDGSAHRLRLDAAHAAYPEDGEGLDALLAALDRRLILAASHGRTVVPFRTPRSAAAKF
jgi:diguanylate cyclase (GGDEF)-like protein/putative nucleotidyltransferase with HDIG domain